MLGRLAAASGEALAAKPAAVIARAASQMTRLIEDLLDTTRLEAGQMHFAPARVAVEDLVASCVEAQRQPALEASVALHVDIAGPLPAVWVDRGRIVQVFDNLIANALRFTPASGSITVGATRCHETVLFWVRDTGRGIPPDHLPRVFDRFWQARKTEGQGAGLGLAIVKSIVEAHRGRIWVESAPGEGSTFYLTLPTASAAARSVRSPEGAGPDYAAADEEGTVGA
jgi:signal transduction histidine kinase